MNTAKGIIILATYLQRLKARRLAEDMGRGSVQATAQLFE